MQKISQGSVRSKDTVERKKETPSGWTPPNAVPEQLMQSVNIQFMLGSSF